MSLLQTLIFGLAVLELSARFGRFYFPETNAATRWALGISGTLLVMTVAALVLSALSLLRPLPIQLTMLIFLVFRPRAQLWVEFLRLSNAPRILAYLSFLLAAGLAQAPNTHWDAQVYHYTLPRLYLERGCVAWTSTGIYDSLVSLAHPLHAWAMGCAGEPGANLLGSFFLLLAGCACYAAAGSWTGPALLLSSPLLVAQADGGLNDLQATAYVAAMIISPQSRWAALWGAAALATRPNALPAVLGWSVCKGPRTGLLLAALAGLLPWLAVNQLHHRSMVYPFSSDIWSLSSFRDSGRSTVTALLAGAAEGWSELLSPLILPGLLLLGGAQRPKSLTPYLRFGLFTLVTAWFLKVSQPRYQMPCLLSLVFLGASGWRAFLQGKTRSRYVFYAAAALLALLANSRWLSHLQVLRGESWQHDYLSQRLAPLSAYEWLSRQSYRKVMLTDPRAYRCPIDFFLVDQGAPGDQSYPVVADNLFQQGCQVVVWNLAYPRVARAMIWQDQHRGSAERGFIQTLGNGWLREHQELWPELTGAASQNPVEHQLRVLYFCCARQPVIFQDREIVVTTFPSQSPWAKPGGKQ